MPPSTGEPGESTFESAGALYEIRIERNRITGMGCPASAWLASSTCRTPTSSSASSGSTSSAIGSPGACSGSWPRSPANMRAFSAYGAVVLADVEDLRFYDNVVENNGPDQNFPVCGLFVLHGEALDIERNRIINTGAKTPRGGGGTRCPASVAASSSPSPCPALPRWRSTTISSRGRTVVPAARIHDNVVSQPLGQALFLQALGPVERSKATRSPPAD